MVFVLFLYHSLPWKEICLEYLMKIELLIQRLGLFLATPLVSLTEAVKTKSALSEATEYTSASRMVGDDIGRLSSFLLVYSNSNWTYPSEPPLLYMAKGNLATVFESFIQAVK
jgi:hypothetical protein